MCARARARIYTTKVKTHKENSVHKLRIAPKISTTRTTRIWYKSAWKQGLKHCGTAVGNYIGTRQKLVEARFAIQKLQKISISMGLSYESNASDRTRIELRMGLKRTPEDHCAAAEKVRIKWLKSKPMTSARLE